MKTCGQASSTPARTAQGQGSFCKSCLAARPGRQLEDLAPRPHQGAPPVRAPPGEVICSGVGCHPGARGGPGVKQLQVFDS